MTVYALGDRVPEIDPDAYVHPDATVIGAVRIGAGSSVWPQAVLRGDYGEITVGEDTSIQDGSVIHATTSLATRIGDRCIVGHLVHMECCVIEDGALVGSGSIILHEARVGSEALVGAAALVPNRMEVPPRAMALGVPAKIRPGAVTEAMLADNAVNVAGYADNGRRFARELRRID